MDAIFFYVFAALAVASAVAVIAQRNPIYSAFALVVTLCSLAVIFGLLGLALHRRLAGDRLRRRDHGALPLRADAPQRESGRTRRPTPPSAPLRGVGLALVTLLVLQAGAVLLRSRPSPAAEFDASTVEMAKILFSPHFLYAFEATSILILAALVGAVVLAKKEL